MTTRFSKTQLQIALSSLLVCQSTFLHAEQTGEKETDNKKELQQEYILVVGKQQDISGSHHSEINPASPDVSSLLRRIPGAHVNANGPLSGIAQYRGLYADQVKVSIDGDQISSGGPNLMDAPLSHALSPQLDKIIVSKGIASVSKGAENLGGHVEVINQKHRLNNVEGISTKGSLFTAYNENNQGQMHSGLLAIGNADHQISLALTDQQGKKSQISSIELPNSHFEKQGLSVGIKSRFEQHEFLLKHHVHEVNNTGTAALPMDINYIDADRLKFQWKWNLNQTDLLSLKFSQHQVEHLMDNFSQRPNMMDMMHRQTLATVEGSHIELDYKKTWGDYDILLGLESFDDKHNAVVSNPNMPMFRVVNFNNINKERAGAYFQLDTETNHQRFEYGLRLSKANFSADEVYSSMAMNMMAVNALMNEFNQANRKPDYTLTDAVFKYFHDLDTNWTFNVMLGHKEKAPTYQQLFLWVPMQATGGLADGKTYVGNQDLNKESATLTNLGISYQSNSWFASANVFYNQVDDYIQGIPSNDSRVKMAANMMGDPSPLIFSNIDANLFGIELETRWELTDSIKLLANASYVRGVRNDNNEALYRIAPLNGHITGLWQIREHWNTQLELHWADAQHRVASYNNEQETAGYGTWNWATQYHFETNQLKNCQIEFRINNLFDSSYAEHLNGINRVKNADIPSGSKLLNMGRNLSLSLRVLF